MRAALRTAVRMGPRGTVTLAEAPGAAQSEKLAAGGGGATRAEGFVQRGENALGDGHRADGHGGGALAVVVRSARHEEPVELGVALVARDRAGVVLGVPHLESVEAAPRPPRD